MANEYGLFFDSQNGDRVYSSDSMAEWLRKFFTTGVFDGELQVTASSGMTVSVASGYANINGRVRFFDSAQQLTLDIANGTYPRIDTIVVRLDLQNRYITCEIVKGLYSGTSPAATEPVRENGIYEIVLAQIYVGAGVTEITQADITDTRADDDLCGWVASTVNELSVEQLLIQAKAKFDAWFETIVDILDEEAAGHLQNEIDALTDDLLDITAKTTTQSTFTITTGGWSSSTVTIDGTAYYTYTIDLNHIYNEHPIVGIGALNELPTTAEQKAYNTFKYTAVDDEEMTMTLYSPKTITSDFVIIVKGVN